MLQPNETLTIWLSCKPKELGLYKTVVYFDVADERMVRVANLLAEDQVSQSLASNEPYLRTQRRRRQFLSDQHCGSVQPLRARIKRFNYMLPEFRISKDVRELLENKQVPAALTGG